MGRAQPARQTGSRAKNTLCQPPIAAARPTSLKAPQATQSENSHQLRSSAAGHCRPNPSNFAQGVAGNSEPEPASTPLMRRRRPRAKTRTTPLERRRRPQADKRTLMQPRPRHLPAKVENQFRAGIPARPRRGSGGLLARDRLGPLQLGGFPVVQVLDVLLRFARTHHIPRRLRIEGFLVFGDEQNSTACGVREVEWVAA